MAPIEQRRDEFILMSPLLRVRPIAAVSKADIPAGKMALQLHLPRPGGSVADRLMQSSPPRPRLTPPRPMRSDARDMLKASRSAKTVVGPSSPLHGPVGVVIKPGAREARPLLRKLASWLTAHRIPHRFDREACKVLGRSGGDDSQHLAATSSMVILIGGDGSLLAIAQEAARADTPILGVNLGTLGFLTEVPSSRLLSELEKLLAHAPRFDLRLMLQMRLMREGRALHTGSALNEVVIHKKTTVARAVDLSVEVDGHYVTSYKSDGLIIATPTGSTAYSLSAGGPILDPKLEVVILNPICPHTLTHRPLVLRDTATILVTVKPPLDGVSVTLDGQRGYPVKTGDTIEIARSPQVVRLLRHGRTDYFHLLRSKLKWGERLGR